MNSDYSKYLKYKNKYLELKKQFGGETIDIDSVGETVNRNQKIDISYEQFLELPEILPNVTYFDRTDPYFIYDEEARPEPPRTVSALDISMIFRKNDRYFAKIGGYYFDVSRIIDNAIINWIIEGDSDIYNDMQLRAYIGSFFLISRYHPPHLNQYIYDENIKSIMT